MMGLQLIDYKEKHEEIEILKDCSKIYEDSQLFKEKISNNTIYIHRENRNKSEYNEILNKDINYYSIYFIFINNKCMDFLKQLNIDFNKIKKLTFQKSEVTKDDVNNNLFRTLFSFNNILDKKFNFFKNTI